MSDQHEGYGPGPADGHSQGHGHDERGYRGFAAPNGADGSYVPEPLPAPLPHTDQATPYGAPPVGDDWTSHTQDATPWPPGPAGSSAPGYDAPGGEAPDFGPGAPGVTGHVPSGDGAAGFTPPGAPSAPGSSGEPSPGYDAPGFDRAGYGVPGGGGPGFGPGVTGHVLSGDGDAGFTPPGWPSAHGPAGPGYDAPGAGSAGFAPGPADGPSPGYDVAGSYPTAPGPAGPGYGVPGAGSAGSYPTAPGPAGTAGPGYPVPGAEAPGFDSTAPGVPGHVPGGDGSPGYGPAGHHVPGGGSFRSGPAGEGHGYAYADPQPRGAEHTAVLPPLIDAPEERPGGRAARRAAAAAAAAGGRTGSPIIAPGVQPAALTAVLGLLLAASAAVGKPALAVVLVLLQAVTAAGWFRLNGMWPARQGIALAFLAGVAADAAILVADGTHAPEAAVGTLGVWLLLVLVLQLRHHGTPDERLSSLTATSASTLLTVLACGYLAAMVSDAGHGPVLAGAVAVAAATLVRALPLPGGEPLSLAAALLAAAATGALTGHANSLGTGHGLLLAAACGACALVGLRVASYDFPSRFVHFTAGVALPLTAAAPVVYVLGRALT